MRTLPLPLLLLAACLCSGEAPAPRFTFDPSPAGAAGTRWENRERVLILAPRFWATSGVNWIGLLTTGIEDTVTKTAFTWKMSDCQDGGGLDYQLSTVAEPFEPTVVVLMPGIASTLYPGTTELTIDAFAQRLRAGVERLQKMHAEVVLATPPRLAEPPDAKTEERLDACAEQIRQIALLSNCTLWDARQEFATALAGGPLHEKERLRISPDGHALLAQGAVTALGKAMTAATFVIDTDEPLFSDQIDFGIRLKRCPDPKQVEIRYTTDGTEPGPTSKLYDKPFRLNKTTPVQIMATTKDGKVSRRLKTQVMKDAFRPADRPNRPVSGLRWAWYPLPAKPTRLPDFAALTPAAEGTCKMFDLDLQARSNEVTQMRREFGVVWRGFLDVPADGVYLFWLRADDGARLLIGDEVIVNHDAPHPAESVGEGRATLRKGLHAITLAYFQIKDAQSVALEYGSRTLRRQPVPQVALSYDAAEKPKPKPKDDAKKDPKK